MTAHIIGGLTVDLHDGPIRTEYSRSHFDGKPTARLVIGQGSDSIAIAVSSSPAETLDQLLEAVSELRAWTATQQLVKRLPEVA
ncbi:hypothetical protein OOK29_09430 [Streptomyces phaeochromogenes]|uniref:hypothetical protein n=1 Tax=Streptomyces phaeochromogenes TaxID=1923 RepID=UPI00224EFE2B|nr:hypothetical protein [Streptomyces phaeochromogenes]MCX5598357.1 hypothetical protein [Streptomyces phaeochromogenes]